MTPNLRGALVRARADAEQQVHQLAALEARIMAASVDDNADDEHDPEGQTIAWDRQQTAAMLTAARQRVADVEDALSRVDAGWDGCCAGCGRPIPAERLEARPTAVTCVRCAAGARGGR